MKRETKQTEVTITVPSDDDPELRTMLEWNKSPDELWESMRKMPMTKQFELYAAARGVSVKAAIERSLQDWMMSTGVGHIADTMSSKADAS